METIRVLLSEEEVNKKINEEITCIQEEKQASNLRYFGSQ